MAHLTDTALIRELVRRATAATTLPATAAACFAAAASLLADVLQERPERPWRTLAPLLNAIKQAAPQVMAAPRRGKA